MRIALCLLGLSLAFLTIAAPAKAAIEVVTPSSMGGWAFYKTDTGVNYGAGDAVAEMVNGPATPPLGTGSAHFNTGSDGFQSAQLRNSSWAGTLLSDITSLSYSTYVTSWNGQQAPFLNIYLSNGDKLWFEPDYSSAGAGNGNPNPQPSPTTGAWQTWDALDGMWYSDVISGPGSNAKTWTAILALLPSGVTIANNAMGGIRFGSGFASSSDLFDTNIDAFTIGTAAESTTYDFELNAAAVPEPASMLVWSLLAVTVGGATWWRRRRVA
jgi:hypothetical protein